MVNKTHTVDSRTAQSLERLAKDREDGASASSLALMCTMRSKNGQGYTGAEIETVLRFRDDHLSGRLYTLADHNQTQALIEEVKNEQELLTEEEYEERGLTTHF